MSHQPDMSCSKRFKTQSKHPTANMHWLRITGIHLMRMGEVEANLVKLNEEFRLPYIADLVARKLAGPEKSKLEDADAPFTKRNISGCVVNCRRHTTRAGCLNCRATKHEQR
jgi:hypothetical protein